MAAETLLRCVQEDQAKAVVFTEVTDGACAGYTLASNRPCRITSSRRPCSHTIHHRAGSPHTRAPQLTDGGCSASTRQQQPLELLEGEELDGGLRDVARQHGGPAAVQPRGAVRLEDGFERRPRGRVRLHLHALLHALAGRVHHAGGHL